MCNIFGCLGGNHMYTVLLVDDEKMALVSTEHSFEWKKNGFHVYDTFTNPYKALDSLKSKRIDVAFVDLKMPEIDGFYIINACRQENIKTDFIIITGYSDFEYAQKAIKLDVFDYCVKPIQPDESVVLLPKLRNALYKKRISDDSKYIQEIINSEKPSDILSYLTLDIKQKLFWVIAISTEENIENILPGFHGNTQIHLMIDNHKTLVIIGANKDIYQELYNFYASLDKGTIFISSALDSIQKIPFTVHLLISKLEVAHSEQKLEISLCDVNQHIDVNESFLSLIDFVNANYNKDLSLQGLSKQYNINYTYCSELFKKVTGYNFSHYLTNIRLKKACDLLIKSEMSISDISYQVGYNDYHYFANVFKKNVGMTPAQYREKLKKGEDLLEI